MTDLKLVGAEDQDDEEEAPLETIPELQEWLAGYLEWLVSEENRSGDPEYDRAFGNALRIVYDAIGGEPDERVERAEEALKAHIEKDPDELKAEQEQRETGQIVVMPGVERRDIGVTRPSKNVLFGALSDGVQDVIVVGKRRDGEFTMYASDYNMDAVVGKLFYATQWLASRRVVHR